MIQQLVNPVTADHDRNHCENRRINQNMRHMYTLTIAEEDKVPPAYVGLCVCVLTQLSAVACMTCTRPKATMNRKSMKGYRDKVRVTKANCPQPKSGGGAMCLCVYIVIGKAGERFK